MEAGEKTATLDRGAGDMCSNLARDCGGEKAFAAMLVETERAGLIDEPEA